LPPRKFGYLQFWNLEKKFGFHLIANFEPLRLTLFLYLLVYYLLSQNTQIFSRIRYSLGQERPIGCVMNPRLEKISRSFFLFWERENFWEVVFLGDNFSLYLEGEEIEYMKDIVRKSRFLEVVKNYKIQYFLKMCDELRKINKDNEMEGIYEFI